MKAAIAARPIKNIFQKISVLGISTGLGLGFIPVAPGTFGSLLGIPLGLYLIHLPTWMALIICLAIFGVFSAMAARAQEHWGQSDCQKIVSDEVLGQALALLSLRHAVEFETYSLGDWNFMAPPWTYVVIGFGLFRILDVVKPYPARTLDRKSSGMAVIADDVVAGLYAAIVLWGIAKINRP